MSHKPLLNITVSILIAVAFTLCLGVLMPPALSASATPLSVSPTAPESQYFPTFETNIAHKLNTVGQNFWISLGYSPDITDVTVGADYYIHIPNGVMAEWPGCYGGGGCTISGFFPNVPGMTYGTGFKLWSAITGTYVVTTSWSELNGLSQTITNAVSITTTPVTHIEITPETTKAAVGIWFDDSYSATVQLKWSDNQTTSFTLGWPGSIFVSLTVPANVNWFELNVDGSIVEINNQAPGWYISTPSYRVRLIPTTGIEIFTYADTISVSTPAAIEFRWDTAYTNSYRLLYTVTVPVSVSYSRPGCNNGCQFLGSEPRQGAYLPDWVVQRGFISSTLVGPQVITMTAKDVDSAGRQLGPEVVFTKTVYFGHRVPIVNISGNNLDGLSFTSDMTFTDVITALVGISGEPLAYYPLDFSVSQTLHIDPGYKSLSVMIEGDGSTISTTSQFEDLGWPWYGIPTVPVTLTVTGNARHLGFSANRPYSAPLTVIMGINGSSQQTRTLDLSTSTATGFDPDPRIVSLMVQGDGQFGLTVVTDLTPLTWPWYAVGKAPYNLGISDVPYDPNLWEQIVITDLYGGGTLWASFNGVDWEWSKPLTAGSNFFQSYSWKAIRIVPPTGYYINHQVATEDSLHWDPTAVDGVWVRHYEEITPTVTISGDSYHGLTFTSSLSFTAPITALVGYSDGSPMGKFPLNFSTQTVIHINPGSYAVSVMAEDPTHSAVFTSTFAPLEDPWWAIPQTKFTVYLPAVVK